ncbi:hypothetical protein [Paraburkholderia sp. J10-1]|uniref:hypothetical protein n=1 Tax=Paraburkholderia sp. J10-1 TaxID=2805430 RepID=UPI002AB6A4D6|nr:hypothetical protein [Paraburkholderia sp. J10-1]
MRQSMHAQRVQLTEPDEWAPGENSPKTRSSNGNASIHDNPAIAPMWRNHDQAIEDCLIFRSPHVGLEAGGSAMRSRARAGRSKRAERRESVALARERKLPAGIIERMASMQRKLRKRRL